MHQEARIPKAYAVLAAILILVGGAGLVTAAAIGGGETFAGLARGDPVYQERSLSHRTLTLGVIVRAIDGPAGDPQPLGGAAVSVAHQGRGGMERVAHATTDRDGTALFELQPGRYAIVVQHDDAKARHAVPLTQDTRIAALIDEEGAIHFHGQTRGEMRQEGRAHNLFLRVGEMIDNRSRAPVEGAHILIERYNPRSDETEPVARNATNARGAAAFYLPPGTYAVNVTTPDGDHALFRVQLDGPRSFTVMFDLEGDATVNQVRPAPPPAAEALARARPAQ